MHLFGGMPANDDDEDTSIRIKVATWKRLDERKDRPNKSFDQIINNLLDIVDEVEEGNPNSTPATM